MQVKKLSSLGLFFLHNSPNLSVNPAQIGLRMFLEILSFCKDKVAQSLSLPLFLNNILRQSYHLVQIILDNTYHSLKENLLSNSASHHDTDYLADFVLY
jgi:hypothetical protein